MQLPHSELLSQSTMKHFVSSALPPPPPPRHTWKTLADSSRGFAEGLRTCNQEAGVTPPTSAGGEKEEALPLFLLFPPLLSTRLRHRSLIDF